MARPVANAAILLALGMGETARDLLAFLGTRLLSQGIRPCEAAIGRIATRDEGGPAEGSIGGLKDVAGPLALAVAMTFASKLGNLADFPLEMHLVDTLLVLAIAVPVAVWLWTYAVILVSADRLGRRTLSLEAFPEDRGLGLRCIGSVAFNGLWVFAAAAVPYLMVVARGPVDYVLGLGAFLFVLLAFVLSLWRLHRQVVLAKARHVAEARKLYLAAYEPLRKQRSLRTLERQAELLHAAEALEKRAEAILEWPIDDRIVGRTVLVATGVVTTITARLILSGVGL